GQIISVFGPSGERIVLNFSDPNQATADGERSTVEFPHPFFQDKQVRQAFNLAIDRDTITTQLYGKTGRPTPNFLIAPAEYYSNNTTDEFNLEKAAKLLDEAGWVDTNGNGIRDKDRVEMRVLFQTSVNPVRQKTQTIIKQGLKSIGVDVELKSIDATIFFSGDPASTDTLNHFYADLQMFTTGNLNPDPANYMQQYMCDQIAQKSNGWSGGNYPRYCNPEYDALWQKSQTELDPEKRRDLFIQMNDWLINDVAVLPIVHRAEVAGVSNSLEGVNLTPWDRNTWNIMDWKRK
ncbi:ABC transporter substrate-binding protein, partial [Okeania sp. SIO1I7]|uniref:ABC transporter substrate-binding protein n=1 Tax=Okeania sp. SIO1I7 TaxID=2607772 RepID=UPI0013FAEB50